MNRRSSIVAVVFMAAMILLLTITAFGQATCVMHPPGDLVPCTHWIPTPYGPRSMHAMDVVPCTHFVPCYQ